MKADNTQSQETGFTSLKILLSRVRAHTFSEILGDWRWILGYSARYKGMIALYVLLGILSTSFSLAGSVAGKYLIDIITGCQTSKLTVLLTVMIGGSALSLIFESVISRISVSLSIDINNDIQADIFDKLMAADWLSLNSYRSGDLLNRFNSDISTVSSHAVTWVPTVILAAYRFLTTFFVILHYDWIMALIAVGSAPLMLAVSRNIIKKQRTYNKQVREMNSKLMAFENETFYNIDTIKSFGVMPYYSRKMRQWQTKFKATNLKYNLFSIKTNIFVSSLAMIVQLIAFGYCLFRLWTHSITYGTMTLFLQQRSQLSGAFNSVVSIIPSFLNSAVATHRIRELTKLPEEKAFSNDILSNSLSGICETSGVSVCIRHVRFDYPKLRGSGEKSDVEKGAGIRADCFTAQSGELVAVIGASGEGKTTLIRLMLGLLTPKAGEIYLTFADGTKTPVSAQVRHLFSYVPQGNTMLSGTIAENMRIVKETATDDEVIEALKIACAWEFVEKLPDTVNAVIGERGRGLSEGQAQRLAIARAILRAAPVLLLDEATSALDAATERRVLDNIIKRQPDKTCIVTTHRPTVLSICSRIYEVKDAKVTETYKGCEEG